MAGKQDLIPPHGGYRKLRSFKAAQRVYDGTVIFCDRFIAKRSRTHDQMVQAARSGVQNIAEGSMAAGTSRKTEIKLTNVARASLEELLLDYQDFLRQRGARQWEKDDEEAVKVRRKYMSDRSDASEHSDRSDQSDQSETSDESESRDQSETSDHSDEADPYGIASASAETAANTLICLIHQASYLLRRQLERLEADFLTEGGFTERLHRERVRARQRNQGQD